MKYLFLIIGICFTFNFNTKAKDISIDDLEKVLEIKHLQTIKSSKASVNNENISHVCHLKNVYIMQVKKLGVHRSAHMSSQMAIVWNNDLNRPLLCEEYEQYIRDLYNEQE